MQYGQRYRIRKTDQTVVEGEYIQTKANDEDYPTFLLDDGSRLGTTRDHVLGPVDDSAPPEGIPRPPEWNSITVEPTGQIWNDLDSGPHQDPEPASIADWELNGEYGE